MRKLSDTQFGYVVGFLKCMELYCQASGAKDCKLKKDFVMDKILPGLVSDKLTPEDIKRKIDRLEIEKWEVAITNIMKNKMDTDAMMKALNRPDSLMSRLQNLN